MRFVRARPGGSVTGLGIPLRSTLDGLISSKVASCSLRKEQDDGARRGTSREETSLEDALSVAVCRNEVSDRNRGEPEARQRKHRRDSNDPLHPSTVPRRTCTSSARF